MIFTTTHKSSNQGSKVDVSQTSSLSLNQIGLHAATSYTINLHVFLKFRPLAQWGLGIKNAGGGGELLAKRGGGVFGISWWLGWGGVGWGGGGGGGGGT